MSCVNALTSLRRFRRFAVVFCVAGMSPTIGSVASATAAAAECQPFPAQRVTPSVQEGKGTAGRAVTGVQAGELKGQAAWTEYFADGGYQSTLCAGGAPVREVRMEPHRLPDGGVEYLPSMTIERRGLGTVVTNAQRGDLRLLGKGWRQVVEAAVAAGLEPVDRSRLEDADVPLLKDDPAIERIAATTSPTTPGPIDVSARDRDAPGEGMSAQRAIDKCSTDYFVPQNAAPWHTGVGYYVNWLHTPAQYHADFTNQTINGFLTWQYEINYCGLPNNETIPTAYLGTTSLVAADATGGTPQWNGGVNVVDSGYLTAGGCAGAIGCAWNYDVPPYRAQSNIRLNAAFPWTIGAQAGFYDIWNIAAHEAGHSVAELNDVAGEGGANAVMFHTSDTGETSKRYLSRGEWWWAENYVQVQ